jgi:hypothetical protein
LALSDSQVLSSAAGTKDSGRAVVIVALALLALDVGVDRVGYVLVRAAGLVLVDHRGPLGIVAHARHEIFETRPALGGRVVARSVPCPVVVQQLNHLLVHPVQVSPEIYQHLRGHAVTLTDQAEQDVLGAYVVVAESAGF